MTKIFKQLAPPFLYNFIRSLLIRPTKYHPRWQTLDYKPLKGLKVYFDPTGPWQKQMMEGTYDAFLFKKIRDIDLVGKTVFDIGAHIGYHSFFFSRLVGPNGKVLAFEPHPRNIERFKLVVSANPDLRKNTTLIEAAASCKEGSEEFNLNDDIESGRSSGGFIADSDTLWEKQAYAQRGFFKKQVKTLRLDDLEKTTGKRLRPDLIKIDVEGAEYLVLMGGRELIKTFRPILLIEIHSMQNMFEVTRFLDDLAYKTDIINKEPDGRCFIISRP